MALIGKELQRRYINQGHMSRTIDSLLVLSSPSRRCVDSVKHLLRGLLNVAQTKEEGRAVLRAWRQCNFARNGCYDSFRLPRGSGLASEWQMAKIDTEMPALQKGYADRCVAAKPNWVTRDLLLNPTIKSLPGIEKLQTVLLRRYGFDMSIHKIPYLCSTIVSELEVARTQETMELSNHFSDWIEQPINETWTGELAAPDEPSMFDLLEQVTVLGVQSHYQGEAGTTQCGAVITSLVDGMKVALGREDGVNKTRMASFKDKKMIIYSTHDIVIEGILGHMGILNFTDQVFTFQRFKKWRSADSTLEAMLSGLKMPSYGMSVLFELVELTQRTTSLAVVQLHIYNEQSILQKVEYKPINFGTICQRVFRQQYPKEDLGQFYRRDQIPIDEALSCPLDLMLNITGKLVANDSKARKLCGD